MSYFPVGVLLVLCLVAALSHALPHSSPRHLGECCSTVATYTIERCDCYKLDVFLDLDLLVNGTVICLNLADEQQLSDDVGEVRMQSADVVTEFKVKDNMERGKRSRAKRSVGWWLAASIHLCDKYPHTCRQVSVQQADLRITVELRDE